ncbi:MAG: hypothetical protein V1777_01465 [Candidatus Micrarchaeota archaeon]
MDSVKKISMQLLSVAAVIGGAVLMGDFFGIDFLEWLGSVKLLIRALLGILVIAYGLIGFQWFSKK